MRGLVTSWLSRYERDALLSLVAVAVVLHGFLSITAPPYGYVWDFYRDGVRVLATDGRLPIAADCWQCYHPPFFYLAGLPLYELGLMLGGDVWAERLLSGLSLVAVGAITWYGYRLLKLFRFSGAAVVGGVALMLASPLLFISSYGAEADVLLSAILSAFVFYLAQASSRPDGYNWRTVCVLGGLAGLAAGTKYSGLVAVAAAGLVTGLRLIVRGDRIAVVKHGLAILVIAVAIGGWKYVDNYRVYGTALYANGSASEGLRLGARENRGGYDFTSLRFTELRQLFGPRPPAGSLTEFAVYKSVLTTLHAQAWSDMSFFSVPTRHGAGSGTYSRKIVPVRLVMAVVVLGLIPELLAVVGFAVTLRRAEYWPLAAVTLVTLGAYVSWFLPQETWALKTKYVACLVPIFAVYAIVGASWLGQRARWLEWGIGMTTAALVALCFVYQFAFANGRL